MDSKYFSAVLLLVSISVAVCWPMAYDLQDENQGAIEDMMAKRRGKIECKYYIDSRPTM